MQNPLPQKLDYLSGRFHWVFPDHIPISKYREVEWFARQIKQEIESFISSIQLRSPRHVNALYEQIDHLTFDIVKDYYEAIAQLIGIPDIEDLTSASRYEFFVQRFSLTSAGIESLPSQLDILLGAEMEHNAETPDKEVPTSGDPIIDVMTSLRLTFKHNASSAITTMGITSCLMMLSLAAEQLKLAQEEAERGDKSGMPPNSQESEDIDLEDEPLDPEIENEMRAIASSGLFNMPSLD
jgi:hypothetical protein